MLINILKQIPQDENIHNEIFNKCSTLKQIDLFCKNYTRQQAIQWYINDRSKDISEQCLKLPHT